MAQLEPNPYLPAGHSKQGKSALGRNLPKGQLHRVGAGLGPKLEHVFVFAKAAHALGGGGTQEEVTEIRGEAGSVRFEAAGKWGGCTLVIERGEVLGAAAQSKAGNSSAKPATYM